MSLKVSATFPASPTHVPGSRTVKSPSLMLCKLASITERSTGSPADFDFPLRPATGAKDLGRVSGTSFTTDLFMTLFSVISESVGSVFWAGHGLKRRRQGGK